jgi:hypothetical protein
VHKGLLSTGAALLAAVLVGSALAQTTTTPTTPATPENVAQLKVTLTDPTMCGNQLDPKNPPVTAFAYINLATNVNYQIAKGDRLDYDVLIPKTSTMAAGAVDFQLDQTPNKGGGPTLRDFPDALDQWGLFAHPASNYDQLNTRLVPSVDASGKVVNVPVFQRDSWYHRDIDISKMSVQKDLTSPVTILNVVLGIDEHDSTHVNDVCPTDPKNPNVIAMFRNINIMNTDATGKAVVKKAIYNSEAKLPTGDTKSTDTSGGIPGFKNATGEIDAIQYTAVTNPAAGQ